MTQRANSTDRLPGLEALRCVAALCILKLHARAVFGGVPFFGRGYLGVEFFLLLSGLLMTVRQEPRWAAGADPWRFMAKRVARLWPLMALAGLLGLPMAWVRAHGNISMFLTGSIPNLLLLPTWSQDFTFPLNIPAWTIFAELVVNALHVGAIWRLRGWWFGALVAAVTAAVLAIGVVHGSFDVGARAGWLWLGAGVVRCLFSYTVGIALGRWWGRTGGVQVPQWLPIPPIWSLVAMPVWVLLGYTERWHGWWPDALFVAVIGPVMLAGGIRMRHGARVATWAGRLAFPLFALQMPVLQAMRYLGATREMGTVAAMAAGIAGVGFEMWLDRRRRWQKAQSM